LKLHGSWRKLPLNELNSNVALTYDIGYLNGAADFQERLLQEIEKEGPFLSTDYIKQLILKLKRQV
jgi:hypothetical protein